MRLGEQVVRTWFCFNTASVKRVEAGLRTTGRRKTVVF
jgi:hypothetical protein